MTAVARIAGETLDLLPERAAFWRRTATLLVADPHFGKAATFRALGVPVPRGTTAMSLTRLDGLIRQTGAARIIFLGDFLHAAEGRDPETLRVLNEWRARHAGVAMTLVRGNHDARAGDPPRELDIQCVDAPLVETPFAFTHHPRPSPEGYVIAGHIHPGARLSGAGRQHTRLPCFAFGPNVAVMPAFGEFTGLAEMDFRAGDQVWVIADNEVIRVA